MRGRLTTVTAALGIAGALALSAAPAALAASGTFTYHNARGETKTIAEPQYNHCYQAEVPGLSAVNHSNTTALLFALPGCHGHYVPARPGRQEQSRFLSVMFMH